MKYAIETERADLFDVNIIITISVKLEKDVSFNTLNTAFKKACTLHEVLKSKIIIEPNGEAYYVDAENPQNSFSKTDLSITELIQENQKRRFKIEDGEFIRAFQSPDGLVFMMHHLGGDGKSLMYFIETFMNCLAGNETAFAPFKNLTLVNLPEKSKVPFFYNMLVKSWNKKWRKQKKVFTFADMDCEYEKFWKNHDTKIEIKKYEGTELSNLLTSAKSLGVSLTAYLITQMLQTANTKMDVGLAVDGRLDNNRSMGNQATGISILYKYNSKKTFEENARCVHKLMKQKLSNQLYRYFVLHFMGMMDSTLKDSLNLERADYFHSKTSSQVAELLGYGKKVKDLSITNLTRADIPLTYGEHTIKEITFIPPIVSYAKHVIGIVTAGDVMTVSSSIYL